MPAERTRESKDAYRSALNMECAASDRFGLQFVAVASFLLFLLRTAWIEGLPGMALLSMSHSAIAQALACLASRRPAFYAKHREAWAALVLFNVVYIVRQLALHGGTIILEKHEGSAVRLLGLMTGATSAVWIFCYTIYARLVISRAAVLLPALAVLPLASNRGVCQRQLTVPGVAGPVAALHDALGLAHVATYSSVRLLTSDVPASSRNVQHCMAIYGWLQLMMGVVLPLVLLRALEQRMRRVFATRQAQQQAQQQGNSSPYPRQIGSLPQADALAAPGSSSRTLQRQQQLPAPGRAPERAQVSIAVPELPNTTAQCAVQLFLASCLAWLVSSGLSVWL